MQTGYHKQTNEPFTPQHFHRDHEMTSVSAGL